MSYKMVYETETRFVVEYHELEKKIQDYYGYQFSIVADQEVGNDVSLDLSIKKKALCNLYATDVAEFRENGRGIYILGTLLIDMANHDIIPEGYWLINICW